MAAFGFSVGDFLAAINIRYTVIEVLKESGGARERYQGVIEVLETSADALGQLHALELEDDEREPVDRILKRYGRTFSTFTANVPKFGALGKPESAKWWKALSRKLWWRQVEKDVTWFQDQVQQHVTALQLVLGRIHQCVACFHVPYQMLIRSGRYPRPPITTRITRYKTWKMASDKRRPATFVAS
jgi:hypothetical protein